ncbi:TRAP transporter substrate-binding protein [Oceanicola sp. D3]|uniref:TRAP transporter substrate-binding protein n=1 Tax=Oceanicola sp. D3 TaxID=2587163 RepID=UPI00143D3D95|nr:TRAP transporter substrate-binding protein [Oceanicola sp. D3]
MTKNVYKAFALLTTTAALIGTQAGAETWRMSTKVPSESFEGRLHQEFADKVAEYTDGEVEIQVYPSEQLGDAQTVLEQVSSGIIDIFVDDVSYLNRFNEDITWTSAPFLFDDRPHWECFMGSDYFHDILNKIEEQDNIGVIGEVGPFGRGFRVLITQDEVTSYEDVQDLKLRLWDNQMIVDVWTALGTDPLVMAWTDVYQSLQTGIVEAVTSPAILVESMKFYEVAPHIARTDEFNQANAYMINLGSWDGISPEDQEAVLRAYGEISAKARTEIQATFDASLKTMQEQGVKYTELDTAPFIKAAASIYEGYEEEGKLPAGFLTAVDAARTSCN